MDPASSARALSLYGGVIEHIVPVSSCEIAEACKILENTYRSVNIAMVNELKLLFTKLGLDIWEVIDAAKTKPFGFHAFYPGPGLGGHCIPIDPFYLTWLARCHEMPTRFIELAGEINTAMPLFVVDRVAEALNDAGKPIKGSKVCVLGVAYKKDIDDPRESPSFKLMELLLHRGASVTYSDPHVPHLPRMRSFDVPELSSQELTPEFLGGLDCVLIATDHSAFDYGRIVSDANLIVDTRNATAAYAGRTKAKIWKA
jgi:UDP-N-acetyl-D-glucosamine dehydrogenase